MPRPLLRLIFVLTFLWGPSAFLCMNRRTIYTNGEIRVVVDRDETWIPLFDHLQLITEGKVEIFNGKRRIDYHQLDDFDLKIKGARIEIANGYVNFFDKTNTSEEPDYQSEIW